MPPARAFGEGQGETLREAAERWAATFNSVDPDEVESLVSEACLEECFDERTNLFLMATDEPTEMALVLSDPAADPVERLDDYLLVRWMAGAWVVDADPVDWDTLEEAAFAGDDIEDG